MPRTVSQTLLDAIANQQGETILRVKTWATLAAYNAAPTVPEQTWLTNKFKIEATEAEAHLITDNDYTLSDFTVFIIERGTTLAGVEYVVQSGIYFVSSFIETDGRLKIKGSSFPDQKIIIDGDDTYENVITAFCTEIGKTATFKDTGAAWLDYQFLPAGKQVILNKAERFLNLIRQKYLILCYERGPKELVFYHATTEQSAWKDIIFADSQLVLAATSGSHEIARSTDGLAYTKIDAASFTNAVAYSPTLDLFAAVGNGVCITSPDGVTWTSRTIGAGNWTGITWDATLAKFVAVATDKDVSYSSDGVNWTSTQTAWTARSAAEANQWRSICWSPELDLFVAVSDSGTNRVMTSSNGTTWIARAAAEANEWYSVCWSPALSLFVAVSRNGTNRVMTSSNGTTWIARAAAEANEWASVCWSPDLSLFVAVSATGTNRVMTSTNGTAWTARSAAEANQWYSVCWSPELDLFVAVSRDGTNRVMTSSNGTAWTARAASEANDWVSVCWSPERSLFVAVSRDGTNRVMTSPNGTAWTARAASEANDWASVCWSPEFRVFVAVSYSGTNRVMTSPTGTDWTAHAATEANLWVSVCWSPDLSLFAAVSYDGTNRVMTKATPYTEANSITATQVGTLAAVGVDTAYTSTDGSSWTTRTIPAGTYHKIIYANGLFVAVGASKCATSPDGITWTARTIPAGTYTGLAYSSTLDLFVAMGDNLLATSPDGITWTSRTAPADQAWQAVAWSDTLAAFYAVSSDGDNRIASSTDGINWQILTTQADYSFSYLDGPTSSIEHGTNQVHYISRDETASVNTSGDTNYPAWNLGYLESTDSAPGTLADPFYKFFLQKAPLRLDLTDGDRVHFEPSWVLDPTQAIDAMILIVEAFDSTKSPAWYQEMRSLALFDSVEGGSLPSTIERVAAYTPLVSSGFDGNLTPEVNNLQALAEAVDDLTTGGTPPPATTAANDFQVGDGSGNWIKKTLAQVTTILGIFADAASDSIYYVRRNAGWTNLKTYTDTLYALLGHTHAASDITSGTMATARLGSGMASATTVLHGDQTYKTAREVLTADRTYYVRTDGSDSNTGLANTSGGAFLTIQKAVDVIASLDCSIYNVTVQIADGTYSPSTILLKSFLGSGTVTIQGNSTTPANVHISTSGMAFELSSSPATYIIKDLKITTNVYSIYVTAGGGFVQFKNIEFAASTTYHLVATSGGRIRAIGNYKIVGAPAAHIYCGAGGSIRIDTVTVTITGTPAWTTAFCLVADGGYVLSYSVTFSGAATGKRYSVTGNGVAQTFGAGANYLPGNSAGTTATGGQYL